MKELVRDAVVFVGDSAYHVEFFSDYEIRFRPNVARLDRQGFICDDYERVPTRQVSSVRLFKSIGAEVVKYLHQFQPPFVWFSAGWDESRFRLYKSLALRLARHGYILAYDDARPNIYYAYRR